MRDIRAGTANHAGWFRLHEKLKISLVTKKELKGKSSTIVLTKKFEKEDIRRACKIISYISNIATQYVANITPVKIPRTTLPMETRLSVNDLRLTFP